ncbi:MAG: hypothetical protein P8Y71_17370 [Pseudolabrys sp.]
MSITLAYALFPICLLGIAGGSILLARGLDEFGSRLNLLPGALGLIVALGANSPEISSAVTAMISGDHEVGVGVVLGSNLFNLAGLIGLGAILARHVRVQRSVLIFNGGISLIVTGIVALLVLGILAPEYSMIVLGVIFAVYVVILSVRTDKIKKWPLPEKLAGRFRDLVSDVHAHAQRKRERGRGGEGGRTRHRWLTLSLIIALSLCLIILSSYGAVHATLRIGSAWGIADGLIGALVLAGLTGLPNVYTASRLALHKNGTAVVSETLNSNTINMVVGIGMPAVVFGVAAERFGLLELWWLLGLTAVSIAVGIYEKGLIWKGGLLIVFLYFGFVAMRVLA